MENYTEVDIFYVSPKRVETPHLRSTMAVCQSLTA